MISVLTNVTIIFLTYHNGNLFSNSKMTNFLLKRNLFKIKSNIMITDFNVKLGGNFYWAYIQEKILLHDSVGRTSEEQLFVSFWINAMKRPKESLDGKHKNYIIVGYPVGIQADWSEKRSVHMAQLKDAHSRWYCSLILEFWPCWLSLASPLEIITVITVNPSKQIHVSVTLMSMTQSPSFVTDSLN